MESQILGPFRVTIECLYTNGEHTAWATMEATPGDLRTQAQAWRQVYAGLRQVREDLGEDWRIASKEEFFDEVMGDFTGSDVKFAMPGGSDWDGEVPPSPEANDGGVET